MTDRAIRELAAAVASLKRQVRALATNARAPFTSVQNGRTRWLDDGGEEAVAIGVDEEANRPFIRVWNEDRSAPVFGVTAGVGAFPLATSTWLFDATQAHAGDLWSSLSAANSGGSFFVQWTSTLSLTSDQVGVNFRYRTTSTAVGAVRLTCQPINTRSGHTPDVGELVEEWTGLTGSGATGFSGFPIGVFLDEVVTVPPSIWSPDSEPAGTLGIFRLQAAVTSGSGNFEMHPVDPLYCREG